MEGHWKFLWGGGGSSKANFLEEIYENKPEFPGGGGGAAKQKKPSMGGVWISSGTAHYTTVPADHHFATLIYHRINSEKHSQSDCSTCDKMLVDLY